MPKYAFFEGSFVPIEEAKVSIMAHAFNYGTGCFEGIRAYWNEEDEQLYLFRMPEHCSTLADEGSPYLRVFDSTPIPWYHTSASMKLVKDHEDRRAAWRLSAAIFC